MRFTLLCQVIWNTKEPQRERCADTQGNSKHHDEEEEKDHFSILMSGMSFRIEFSKLILIQKNSASIL